MCPWESKLTVGVISVIQNKFYSPYFGNACVCDCGATPTAGVGDSPGIFIIVCVCVGGLRECLEFGFVSMSVGLFAMICICVRDIYK
jgi:hypothetical protein